MWQIFDIQGMTLYTRLNKISGEVIRKELEISGIKDVKSKCKQNWVNHLEIMDNTRLQKNVLNYKPRGRKHRGRTRKRWQRVDAVRHANKQTNKQTEFSDLPRAVSGPREKKPPSPPPAPQQGQTG